MSINVAILIERLSLLLKWWAVSGTVIAEWRNDTPILYLYISAGDQLWGIHMYLYSYESQRWWWHSDTFVHKTIYSLENSRIGLYDYNIQELSAGTIRKDSYNSLLPKGYKGNLTAADSYMNKIIKSYQIDIAVYRSSIVEIIQKKKIFRNIPYGWVWTLQMHTRDIWWRNRLR